MKSSILTLYFACRKMSRHTLKILQQKPDLSNQAVFIHDQRDKTKT